MIQARVFTHQPSIGQALIWFKQMPIDRHPPLIKKGNLIRIVNINLLYRKLFRCSQKPHNQLYSQMSYGLFHKLKDIFYLLGTETTVTMTSGAAKPSTDTSLARSSDNSTVAALKKRKKGKTHDYTPYQHGTDYVFETINGDEAKGYMTGQGKGIKPGDYMVLRQGSVTEQYLIEKIDYYSSPADIWVALLSRLK